MMWIRFCTGFSLLLLFLASYGCGGSAEIERKQAKDAMERAKSLHSEKYAPMDFEKAQTAWDRAETAEKEGRTDNAKVLFTSAKIFYGKSADIAKSKKDALSREVEKMQIVIGTNLDQVKSDLSNKVLSSGKRGQVDAIVSEVEKGNALIQKLVEQEELVRAVAAAKDLQTKLYHAQLILAGQKVN